MSPVMKMQIYRIVQAIFSIIYFFPKRTSIVHKNANIFTTVSKYGALLFFYLHFVLIPFKSGS